MYIRSPMENFNKNNPYIIIAKKKYDNIVDSVQLFSKTCITWWGISSLLWIIMTALFVVNICREPKYILSLIIPAIVCIILVITIFTFRRRVNYFLTSHPDMAEFSRLSEMEVNDIIALNSEAILKCTNGLYKLHGEIETTIKYYKLYLQQCIAVEFIISTFLTVWLFI